MELFIIRHAQSANNALPNQRERVVDPPLTELGRQQAQCVGQYAATGTDLESAPHTGQQLDLDNAPPGLGITRLYCSAMLRALETAQVIGRAIRLQPQVWIDIHEQGGMWLDHGEPEGVVGYPGMTRGEIIRRFPDAIVPAEVNDRGWWCYEQEELEPFQLRAVRVAQTLRAIARQGTEEHIAIVTHGAFTAEFLKAILGVPAASPIFFHHDNTGITRVRFRMDGSTSVRYQNRLTHLPPEMVT